MKKKPPDKPELPPSVSDMQQDQLTIGLLHNFITYAGFTALRMSIMRECGSPEEAKQLFEQIVDSWASVTKSNITMEAERLHSDSRGPFHQLLRQMMGNLDKKQDVDVEDMHVAHVKAVNEVVGKMKEMVKWEDAGV